MTKNTITVFLFFLNTTVFAQFAPSVFITTYYEWPIKELQQDSLKKKILLSLVSPQDTFLNMGISCLRAIELNSTSKDKYNKVEDLVSLIDLNGDGIDDVVFNSYDWGCGINNSYMYYNIHGQYKVTTIPSGYISNVEWKGKRLSGLYIVQPPCCNFFYNISKYYKINTNGHLKIKYTVIYFDTREDSLIKYKSYTKSKIDNKNDTILICMDPKNEIFYDSLGEYRYEKNNIIIKNKRCVVLAHSNNFRLIGIRIKRPDHCPPYISRKTYYVGWTK
jgi:hypothetical protein